MLSLPHTITVEIATPTIGAMPDGAATGAQGGAAQGWGFAATMLATQPVATKTFDHAAGAGEPLPATGNTLPQQTEVPIRIAGASLRAPTPAADLAVIVDLVEGATATSGAMHNTTNTATNTDTGTLLDTRPDSATADVLPPTVTAPVVASPNDAPLADLTDSAIPATPADIVAPAGLINPPRLLGGAEAQDTEVLVEAQDLANPPATAGATAGATQGAASGSDDLRAPLLAPDNFTDKQLQMLQENAGLQAGALTIGVPGQPLPALPASPRIDPSVGFGAANRLEQGALNSLKVAQADPASLHALVGKTGAFRDDTAPILTARLNDIPAIQPSRQHGVTGGLTAAGDSLPVTVAPRPDALPHASIGHGWPETRISLQGAPQIVDVDADLKSLQRMLATPAPNPVAADTKAPVTAQPAATLPPANVTEVLRPEAAAPNLPRAAQSSAVLADTALGSTSSIRLNDSLQLARPPLHLAGQNPAASTPPQSDTVTPIPVVAPPRYIKSSASPDLQTPVATPAVPATAGPDLITVDSAPIVAKHETGSVALPPAAALTTPPPAATTGSTPAPQVLNLPVTDNAWGNAVSERVAVLAGQKITSANIRLNPAELGPLRVEIKVEDGNAQVHFIAQHAVTRDAIEQALPRLRELLAAEGLDLTGADVSEQGVARDRGEQSQHARSRRAVTAGEPEAAQGGNDEPVKRSRSDALVDTFA